MCWGRGGLWYFPLINQHLLREGQKKNPEIIRGGFKKMKGKNKEIIIAHPLDKLWMLPKQWQAVRSVASGSKIYWLPPDKENTAMGSSNVEAVCDMVWIISGIAHCRVNDFSECYHWNKQQVDTNGEKYFVSLIYHSIISLHVFSVGLLSDP